ncbi:MAG: protein kinase [Deltaproteobacteria bacterium]|nr:protein kinase [Deltaproteobacteria bacterium]
MGAVYLVEHAVLGSRKVMKVLLPEYANNEILRQRFESEALVSSPSRVKPHKSVVTVEDYGVLPDGQLFLIMPFLDGRPLDQHIGQNGTLTLHHTFHLIVQLCRALQHLHDHRIVHRDLKPGNVFIVEGDDNPYEVILIDLGIARDLAAEPTTRKTQTGLAMGTPGYMPPEQMGNAAGATAQSDLYAVAIIAWEMLFGEIPWGRHVPSVLYHLQMTQRPEPPAGHSIPADVVALLLKNLSVDPSERHASARAFANAFASRVPPIPPHVPSGAEILARYARQLVEGAGPELETVRNSSKGEHATPLAWPYRSTQVPMLPQEVPISAMSAGSPMSNVARVASPTPVQPGTVPARPNARAVPVVPPSTTLGASSGVLAAVAPPSPRRASRMWALGVAGAIVVGFATFGVVATRARSDEPHPTAVTPADEPAAPTSPATAPGASAEEERLAPASMSTTLPTGERTRAPSATVIDAGTDAAPDAAPAAVVDVGRPTTTPAPPSRPSGARPQTTTRPTTDPRSPAARATDSSSSSTVIDPEAVAE